MSNYFDDEIKCPSASGCGICYPEANRDELVEVRGPDDFETPETNETQPRSFYAVNYLSDGEERNDIYDTLYDAKEGIAALIDGQGRGDWEISLYKNVPFTVKSATEVLV